ncbi:DUF4339 domain-containing protein [Flavobacterium sp.]|uniref:DUF4339 domain-containing protein n=1 Tax=Flavobacterium sp. TaxID=239 RepID=UPI003752E0A9
MKKYYLHNGSENIGPFDIEELKEKKITRDTPIWCEGMSDWKNVSEVEELSSVLAAIPPPIKKIVQEAPRKRVVEDEPKKRSFTSLLKKIAIVFLVIVGLFSIISIVVAQNDSSAKGFMEESLSPEEMEATYPTNYLTAGGNYHKNFLGTKLVIDGYIDNKATITAYKDVTIEVIFYDNSKTELNRESFTVNDFISANSRKEFKHKINNYSNVETIGWEVSNAVPNR